MTEPAASHKTRIALWTKRILAGLFIFWLALYLLIWSLSPLIIRWQANEVLLPLKLQLSENSSVRVNPFILQLSLSNIQLTGSQSTEVLASIGSAVIDLDAFKLFSRVIRFEQLQISDISIDARRTANYIEIAGWQLNDSSAASQNATTVTTANQDTSTAEQTAESIVENSEQNNNAWRIDADHFDVNGLKLNIDNLGQAHTVDISQLAIDTLALSETEQQLSLNLNLLLDNAPIEIVAEFQRLKEQGQVSLGLKAERLNLQKLAYLAEPSLTHLSGYFSLDLQSQVKFDAQQVFASLANVDLILNELSLGTPQVDVNLLSFSNQWKDVSLQLNSDNRPQIEASFNLQNEQTQVKVAGSDDVLLQFKHYALEGGKLTLAEDPLPAVSIEQFQFEQLKFSEKAANEKSQPLVQIANVEFNHFNFSDQHLSLKSLFIKHLIGDVTLDENKQLVGLVMPSTSQPDGTIETEQIETEQPSEKEATQSITFSLGQLAVADESRFSFSDKSVNPPFIQAIELQSIEINDIDNRQANNKATFSSDLKVDAYAGAQFNGSIQPFSEKMNLLVDASVKEFSLPAISPYLRDAMGFEMLSGQFDTTTHLTITDNIIKGESKLAMRGMELSSVDSSEGNTLKEQSAMPLNSALGLLMDDKGNLELTLPLSGDVSDPNFGISSFVAVITKKAVMSAAQNYLLDTFIPYANVLKVVMVAGDYMLKVSFEDLIYTPTTISIVPEQEKFIEQFVTLLKDQPETQVKVCAYATPADLPQQAANLADAEYQQQLLQISRQRGEAFKAWVVEKGAIDSSRLLLCQPKVDNTPKGKPRIEFSV